MIVLVKIEKPLYGELVNRQTPFTNPPEYYEDRPIKGKEIVLKECEAIMSKNAGLGYFHKGMWHFRCCSGSIKDVEESYCKFDYPVWDKDDFEEI